MPIIGAHVSVAGGLYRCFANGESIGAECLQIFGASPRQWQANLPNSEDVNKFLNAQKKSEIKAVFLHAPYLINVCSPDQSLRQKSINCLSTHLAIAKLLKAKGLIFHLGSRKDLSWEISLKYIVIGLKTVLKTVSSGVLIIENSAGSGNTVGRSIDELAQIFQKLKSPRLKLCLDTAHLFASGELTEFSLTKISRFFSEVDQKIGLKKLVAMHVNDSQTSAGSNRDRHENIGEGFIGLTAFKNLAQEKCLNNMPWILEVPGFSNNGPDKKNIDILKKICQ